LDIRRGLGPARAKRAEIPDAAPRALGEWAQIRYLRAVQACSSPRDSALALVPFYAGARISETVALDLDDVRVSARKGVLATRPRPTGNHTRLLHISGVSWPYPTQGVDTGRLLRLAE
jgi:hypothetical protein